jgi:DNA polymerase-3 subunit delta'
MRRDLHMRPFEADRRVYLVHHAHLLNEDAADALLKDLEEPPPYAVIVLIADDIGSLPDTLRSRCQPVLFRRLSESSIRALVDARAPTMAEEKRIALSRVAAGRLDRMERLLDPQSVERREVLIEQARAAYSSPSFDASEAAAAVLANASARGAEAREREETRIKDLDLTSRDADQRVKRAGRGAEREELLAELEELGAWYRDLVAVAVGAESAAIHFDKLVELREDATRERLIGAERAADAVRETWRRLEELNLAPQLALEALFVRISRELA